MLTPVIDIETGEERPVEMDQTLSNLNCDQIEALESLGYTQFSVPRPNIRFAHQTSKRILGNGETPCDIQILAVQNGWAVFYTVRS